VLLLGCLGVPGGHAETLDKIDIVIFGAPSLGAFLPPVIKAKSSTRPMGWTLPFPSGHQTPTRSRSIRLNSKWVEVRRCASNRGVKLQYLFSLFDLWGAVVMSHADIKSLLILEASSLPPLAPPRTT